MFKKKHFSLEIVIDDEFDGIIYGSSDNPSGCKLKGKLVLIGKKSIKIKALTFLFIGRATVSCGPPLSSSRPEYSEVEEILQKKCIFHQADGSQHKVPAGVHEYHFEYDLPPNLPPSFKGTRGKIEYSCHAILERPLFSNDVMVKKEVTIKRCLINDVSTSHPQQLSSFTENTLDEKIYYQIDSPIISFREGGLVSLELLLKPLKSDISIEFVEYGLKERINYRTTGERAMSVIANVDEDRFPLGKKLISIDPSSHNHNHNDIGYDSSVISINFRLCPWVNNDIESQLINVSHKLSFTIGYKEKVSGLTMFEVESNFGGDACDTRATTFARNNRRFSTPVNRSSLLQNDVGAGRIRSVMNNRRSMNFGIYRHRDNNNDVHGERNASDDDGHNGNVNSTINSDTNDNNNNNNNNNNDDNNNNNNNNHRTQRDSVSNGINNFRRSFNLVSYLNSNNNNNLRKSITHSSGVIKRSRRIRFEIPIIITSKPSKPIQQAPDYSVDDEPPAYIYSTMIPSPPEYAVSTTNHYNRSTIIVHHENDDYDD